MFNDDVRDEPLDEQMSSLARSYNEPSAVPKDEIWARIQAARQPQQAATATVDLAAVREQRRQRRLDTWRWPIAAAALLALGIGIGRFTVSQRSAGDSLASQERIATALDSGSVTTPDRLVASEHLTASRSLSAYAVATASHLAQTESYLTAFRAQALGGHVDSIPVRGARQLLASNQLLLDSPAARDPRLRALLQDLELVLMEISQFGSNRRPGDLDLITEGMERGAVLTRLRVAAPAGSRPLPQGIL